VGPFFLLYVCKMSGVMDRIGRWAEFKSEREQFYALIGKCIMAYQTVEDTLPQVFATALGGPEERALAIFSFARGLEAKLDMIGAALADAPEERRESWYALRKRIAQAAEARNQIAHAIPSALLDPSNGVGEQARSRARMELRKRTRNDTAVWSMEMLSEENKRVWRIFTNLIALELQLRGEPVSKHLLDQDPFPN
jgi:hypothetical protein